MNRKNCFICGVAAALLAVGATAYAAGNGSTDQTTGTCGQPQGKCCCIRPAATKIGTAGAGSTPSPDAAPALDTVVIVNGVQEIRSVLALNSYPDLIVQAGLPVRWIITTEEANLTGCNNAISIPSLNIYQRLAVGENIIEFLPDKTGVINYSCWMGMITATITVTEQAP
jgi:hypothetical protein